jgi:hypothetical protein
MTGKVFARWMLLHLFAPIAACAAVGTILSLDCATTTPDPNPCTNPTVYVEGCPPPLTDNGDNPSLMARRDR